MISSFGIEKELTESGLHDNFASVGSYLAESKWSDYCNDPIYRIEDDNARRGLAVLLENMERYLASMDETTRAVSVGDFQKYAFPLVRAIFPELVANSLVSVQPMLGPTSMVFYMDFIYASNKGGVHRGDTMFSSVSRGPNNPGFTSPQITDEAVGTGDGATQNFAAVTLNYGPVVPGSFSVTDGVQVVTDDGQGNLVGNINSGGTNTINYGTGVVTFSFAVAPTSGNSITATYTYDMEANQDLPEVDMQINSTPVIARPRKLRARWSLESGFNLRSLHGLEVETELTAAIGANIRYEIDREIIDDLQRHAGAGSVFWNTDLPSGVGYTEHKLSIIDAFTVGQNLIHKATGRGTATWILCGENVATVVETLPGFIPTPGLPNGLVKGVYRAGTLNGRWEIFKDPFYTDNYFSMGFKGQNFLEAGYVYAPYIPLYSTPTVVLDDFIGRKGLATSYGKKAINPLFYVTGEIGTGAALSTKAGISATALSTGGTATVTHGSATGSAVGKSNGRGVFGV